MRFAPFFVLRTPLLAATSADGAEPSRALSRPIVREALRWASTSIAEALESSPTAQAERAATRYLARMRGRPTPFSLLAGYSAGRVYGPTTTLKLGPIEDYVRFVRLDRSTIARAVIATAHDDATEASWVTRADVQQFPDLLRVHREDGNDDVARSDNIDALLARARQPASFAELVACAQGLGAARSAAESFVTALIDIEILVPANCPSVYLDDELSALPPDDRGNLIAETLRPLRETRLGDAIDVGSAAANVGVARDELIVDLVKPPREAVLGRDVLRALEDVVFALQRTQTRVRDPRITAFAANFRQRYERRSVRLVEALDPRRGLPFPPRSLAASPVSAAFGIKLALFETATRQQAPGRLVKSALPRDPFWTAYESGAVSFSVANDPLSIWSPSVDGVPGTKLFARGTAILPPQFRADVRDFLVATNDRFASEDVCDLAFVTPGGRNAVTQYPSLQPFTIELTAGRSQSTRSLDLNAIEVRCSRSGDVRLHSRETGRDLRLRPTSAINGDQANPMFRFLFALGRCDAQRIAWDWEALDDAARLPRVCLDDHVLSPAMWSLSAENVLRLRKAKTQSERWDVVQRLRADESLPPRLRFVEGRDNSLSIDLDDRWSVDAWLDVVRDTVKLSEEFPVERSFVEGPEGSFHHEVIVPFVGAFAAHEAVTTETAPPPETEAMPTFDAVLPGRDVFYVRIRGDSDVLFDVLDEVVATVVRPGLADGAIAKWFFLPFVDTQTEIRLRLFGAPSALWLPRVFDAIRAVVAPHVEDRSLSSLSIETYERETYRYGGARGMDLAERFFQQSSELALRFRDKFSVTHDDFAVWLPAHVGAMRTILHASGMSLSDQRDVAKCAAARYDWHAAASSPRQIASAYFRANRMAILAATSGELGLNERDAFSEILNELRTAESDGALATTTTSWLADCLHVHSLRVLTAWHPLPHLETVAYLLLAKVRAADAMQTVHAV